MRACAAFACLVLMLGQSVHAQVQSPPPVITDPAAHPPRTPAPHVGTTPSDVMPSDVMPPPPIVEGVVGGSMVPDGEAPWMAEIFKSTPYDRETRKEDHVEERLHNGSSEFLDRRQPWDIAHICGAVLIAPNWVLTAKHCITDVPAKHAGDPITFFRANRRIRVGTYAIGEGVGTICPPTQVIPHRGAADIALIRIERATCTTGMAAQTPTAAPIAAVAARNAFTPQTRLAVYGWGMIRKRTADAMAFVVNDLPKDDTAEFLDPESPFLQVGTPLYFVPPKACLATPGYAGFVRPDMICAGVASGKIDQCNGDSGGPLMQRGSGSSAPVLVGIVEGGDGCGLAHTPGVYVYVPAYRDWIARTIGRGSLRKGRAILAAAGRKTT